MCKRSRIRQKLIASRSTNGFRRKQIDSPKNWRDSGSSPDPVTASNIRWAEGSFPLPHNDFAHESTEPLERKIENFADHDPGWHFGAGVPASPVAVAVAFVVYLLSCPLGFDQLESAV